MATTTATTRALDFRVRGVGLQDFMFFDPEGSTDLKSKHYTSQVVEFRLGGVLATTTATTRALDFRVRGVGLQDFMFFDPEVLPGRLRV